MKSNQKSPHLLKTAVATAVLAATSLSAPAFADSKLEGSIRIGYEYRDAGVDADGVDPDAAFNIRNFGSRLRWSGNRAINGSTDAIAYLELGLNPDANGGNPRSGGVDRTRHLWAGLSGNFGTVKIGAQYSSFYDMVQGKTDIAWWGSCFQQFECSRETNVLKFTGKTGGLSYSASVESAGDADDDVADEFEIGANFTVGKWGVGVAAAMHSDEGADDGGTLVGAVATGGVGIFGVRVGVQVADEDFANSADDFTHVTVAATLGDLYAVANVGDNGPLSPSFATLGYTLNLGPGSLFYFEAQTLDSDEPGTDATTIGRATYVFTF